MADSADIKDTTVPTTEGSKIDSIAHPKSYESEDVEAWVDTVITSGPKLETGDEESKQFDSAIKAGLLHAIELIHDVEESDDLYFHTLPHTVGVVNRCISLMQQINADTPGTISAREYKLVLLAAMFHDTHMAGSEVEATAVDGDTSFAVRKYVRKTSIVEPEKLTQIQTLPDNPTHTVVGGEEKSVKSAYQFMRDYPQSFTREDIDFVCDSIYPTAPVFRNGEVLQPGLREDMPVANRILALADLGEYAVDPERAVQSSVLLFIEENVDIRERVLDNSLPDEGTVEAEFLRNRIVNNIEYQVKFVETRMRMMTPESDLKGMPETVQRSIQKVYSRYKEALRLCQEEVAIYKAPGMTLASIAAQVKHRAQEGIEYSNTAKKYRAVERSSKLISELSQPTPAYVPPLRRGSPTKPGIGLGD